MLSGGGHGSDDEIRKDGDRLSSLPEHLIHHIFSSLETIDIVRASLVSRKWRYFWLSMPYLSFKRETESYENFRDLINRVLMSRNRSSDIQRFCVWDLPLDDDCTFFRWMDYITRKNLQELDLIMFMSVDTDLPQCIFNCGSLVSLKLNIRGYCVLKQHIFPGFRRLKLLELRCVGFLHSGLLRNLISSCPVLENCTIDTCRFHDLKILDITAPRLKNLWLDLMGLANYQLKVACPNLMSLTLLNIVSMDLLFEEMNSLQNLCMDHPFCYDENVKVAQCYHVMSNILKTICDVKVLKVGWIFMKYLHLAVDSSKFFFASFNNLKSLTLTLEFADTYAQGQATINLLAWSPNLEALTITFQSKPSTWEPSEDCDDHRNMLNKTISCLKSHLKTIELIDVGRNKYELELIRFFLKNGHILEEIKISWNDYFWYGNKIRDKIVSRLMKFPRSSPNVTLTFVEPQKCGLIFKVLY